MSWLPLALAALFGASISGWALSPAARWLLSPPLLHVWWLAAAGGVIAVVSWELVHRGDKSELTPTALDGIGRLAGPAAGHRGITIHGIQAIESALGLTLKGQNRAIHDVVDALKLAVVGTAIKTRKPVATFLLVGATGTGKTELAKTTAEALGRTLVRLDMPNFSGGEGAFLLTGSQGRPVTSPTGAPLISAVRACPDAVVLLDEIEKAAPTVWDPFLRLFDEGVLKDPGSDHDVDFSRTIIFLTSNLLQGLEPQTPEDELRRRLVETEYFRPELVNRIDRIILFAPFEPSVLREIARKAIVRIVAQFHARQGFRYLVVEVDHGLVDLILGRCDPHFGARAVQREAEITVGKALADAFLDAGRAWQAPESLWLGIEGGKVLVRAE